MSSIVFLALLLAWPQVAPGAIPPPPSRTTAECASPVYAVDHLICSDTDLSREEGELAGLYARSQAADEGVLWIEDQRAWLSRRARCAFQEDQRSCVVQANAERRHILSPATGSRPSRSAFCPGAGGSSRLSLVINNDVITGYNAQGRKLFVATRASPEWTPFVQIFAARRLEFRRQDGAVLRCRFG